MQQLVSSFSNPTYGAVTNSDNSTIFYKFVGNFVPPEWRDLQNSCGKVLSKTARQLLSLIVFRLQVYNSSNLDELQESYHFFEQSLGVCQRRIRQCMLELQESGFIYLHNTTVVKHHIKCRNTPCIKLAKNFQPYPKNFSGESEKSFGSTRKKFQPHNIIDINNKSNISRSSESTVVKNAVDEQNVQEQEQRHVKQQAAQWQEKLSEQVVLSEEVPEEHLTPEVIQVEGVVDKTKFFTENVIKSAIPIATQFAVVAQKFANANEVSVSSCSNDSALNAKNSRFRKKNLTDFYPLTEADADLLQFRSKREFNLRFINQLLIKLAEQYPDHHFCNKKVVMNYMSKALMHELRESNKTNCSNFRFKTHGLEKIQEQYLEKIESSTSNSKQEASVHGFSISP